MMHFAFRRSRPGLILTAIFFLYPPGQSVESAAAERDPAAKEKVATARGLFRQHCARCHDHDGTGARAQDTMPRIPDFTNARWQEKRSDHQLVASVLVGKGTHMPPFQDKLSKDQIHGLVAHVRGLDATKTKSDRAGETRQHQDPPSDFDKRFRELQEQLEELRKQFHDLSAQPPESAPSRRSHTGKAR